jgi:DMSO reductase family type II enzyme heme b subunit
VATRARAAALSASAAAAAILAAAAASQPRRANPQTEAETGRAVYQKWCAGCHGDQGRGDGPAAAYLLPRPRDFTRALYQVRSTATGEVPLASDIHWVLEEGMPGTSMPGWSSVLTGGERDAVVEYVRSFSSAFATAPQALEFGSSPGGGQAAIDSGRALFRKIECFKCHGQEGRGDGQSAPTLKDDFDFPVRAADLTRNWTFNGGGEVEDIYRRLRTGLDGTPMPSFSDLIDGNIVSDDDLWRVAMYVRSLSPERLPRVRDVVRADRVEGALPQGPEDSAWAAAERFYLPLVGQVIVRPRQFSPAVNEVFVQALHDGSRLAVRVTWSDASRSPDTTWNVWRRRMARSLADDSVPWDTTTALPDRLAIQFPVTVPEGMERPYFLMGTAEKPVYLWDWQSEPQAAVEALARGIDRVEPMSGLSDTLTASASHHEGEWRVQFTRALVTSDTTGRLQFATGRVIPMAVFAWDGSNNEVGARAAVASWNAIYLAEPAGAGTVVSPVAAVVLTLGLLLLIVRQAERAQSERMKPGVAEVI